MSESKSSKPDYRQGKCEYLHYGSECPYPGVWSDSVREGGSWFCHFHKDIANRDADQPHVDRLRNMATCDWRDQLRQQILSANLRWLKRDDESTKDYQDRMLTEMHLLRPRVTEP